MTRAVLLEVAFALVLAAIGIYQRRWMGDTLLIIAALILCYVVVTSEPFLDSLFSRPRTVSSFVVAIAVSGGLGALLGAVAWFVTPAASAKTATPAVPPTAHVDALLAQTVPEKPQQKAKEQKPVDAPAPRKDQPSVIVGPGGAASFNQQGGITAGTLNIFQSGIPAPKFVLEPLVGNQPEGELYRTEFMLKIESQVPIPNLYVQVDAPSITKIDAAPQRTGGHMFGHGGVRDGFVFTTLQNAYGIYKVTVRSKKPEKFEVTIESR